MAKDKTLELGSAAGIEAAPAKRRFPLGRVLRPAVSVVLLALLLRGARASEFLDLARRADLLFLGLGVLLVLSALAVSAYKWQRLLTVQKVAVPLPKLFTTYLVGLFFNNFLPTNIGGDVVRMHEVARHTGKTPESVASVLAERLLASFALALTAALGLALNFRVSASALVAVAVIFVFTLGIIAIFANERWRRVVGRVVKLPNVFRLRERLGGVAASMSCCLGDRGNVAWVLFYSVVFHLHLVLINYVVFLALGLSVPFVSTLLFIPIISALQMLPISISGFGVREGAYVYFFASAGLSSTEAIASSVIFWALAALVSLAGGLIFALRR